ncbi:MAG: hypothetical protein ACJAYU_003886 [Bradymonadia bacterium]
MGSADLKVDPVVAVLLRHAPKLGLLVLAGLAACGDGVATPDEVIVQAAGTTGYTLDWDLSGAALDDDGWSILTDLGYEVRLDSGWLVNYTVQLIPCETAQVESSAVEFMRAALRSLNPIQTAWAGHGDDNDVTTLFGVVEDLAHPLSTTSSDVGLGQSDYCSLHYLVARADQEVVERPEDIELERLSLTLSGSWTGADGLGTGEFELATALGFGVILALPDELVLGPGDAAHFVITRQLDEVFAGVDFATSDTEDLERAVVRGIVESATLTVRE